MSTRSEDVSTSLPIACNLTGAALAARGDEVREVFATAHQARELPDGYAFAFPSDEATLQQLIAFISTERACCPFFTFELRFEPRVEPDQNAVWLALRGGSEIKEMVADGWSAILGRLRVSQARVR